MMFWPHRCIGEAAVGDSTYIVRVGPIRGLSLCAREIPAAFLAVATAESGWQAVRCARNTRNTRLRSWTSAGLRYVTVMLLEANRPNGSLSRTRPSARLVKAPSLLSPGHRRSQIASL